LGDVSVTGSVTIQTSCSLTLLGSTAINGTVRIEPMASIFVGNTSTLLIEGELLVSSQSQFDVLASIASQSAPIKLSSCLNVTGANINVHISNEGTYSLVDYNCSSDEPTGQFSNIEGYTDNPCDKVSVYQNYTASCLQVQFSIGVGQNCKEGFPLAGLIAIALVAIILFISVVIVAVIFGVPTIRRKVLPHKDRAIWSASAESKRPQ